MRAGLSRRNGFCGKRFWSKGLKRAVSVFRWRDLPVAGRGMAFTPAEKVVCDARLENGPDLYYRDECFCVPNADRFQDVSAGSGKQAGICRRVA